MHYQSLNARCMNFNIWTWRVDNWNHVFLIRQGFPYCSVKAVIFKRYGETSTRFMHAYIFFGAQTQVCILILNAQMRHFLLTLRRKQLSYSRVSRNTTTAFVKFPSRTKIFFLFSYQVASPMAKCDHGKSDSNGIKQDMHAY